MSKRFVFLMVCFFVMLSVISYAAVTVNIEPNNEGVIDKSKSVNVVIKLSSDLEIDMSQVLIAWNGQDITQAILETAASQFNDNKTEVTFYYPISGADLPIGMHSITASAGSDKWYESKLAIEALDDKSLHFSYSTPKVTRAVADALILAKSSSASSGKAGKTCTVVACDYVPTLDGSSKCGSINAKTGNKYKCCDNNWDGKNKAPDGNCT
jgi:hypothetical protein